MPRRGRSRAAIGYRPGPLGRLGVAVTRHTRLTAVVWLLVIIGLGAFAPKVEAELSGAGWPADGSESVAARELAQDHFGGNASTAIQVVVHSTDAPVTEGDGARILERATAMLEEGSRIADVVQPQPGATLSAMLKSELYSWPATLAILVLAFGALIAAGLPLVLTLSGWSPRPARSCSSTSLSRFPSGR